MRVLLATRLDFLVWTTVHPSVITGSAKVTWACTWLCSVAFHELRFNTRYLKPKYMTGVELSTFAVDVANKTHSNVPNLRFVQGDALNLQFENDRFDVVLNVESGHCYPDFLKFGKEVYRVLKPGGYLAFADMVMAPDVASINEHFDVAGFTVIEQFNISSSVLRALQKCSDERLRRWKERFGPFSYGLLLPMFQNFACVEGSQHYKNFASGDLKYLRYVVQKPINQTENQCPK